MRKVLVILVSVVALGLGSTWAQGDITLGASAGFPYAAAHVSIADLAAGLDVRANVVFALSDYGGGDSSGFGVGADVLYGLDFDLGIDVDVYAGAGATFTFGTDQVALLNAFIGGTYPLDVSGMSGLSLFAEVGPGFTITAPGDNILVPVARVGVNFELQ
ncbi:MAG: hypothetical protein JSV66_03640 [Trueperaceae bacterium]|nr:MAG: hypothetical protein JSV66_03640 [Trueperaceae bacterium]